MFGGSIGDLVGRTIRPWLPDFMNRSNSRSYNSRYIAYLFKDGRWHRHQAVAIFGQHFPIEVALSWESVRDDGYGLLLLRLRHPELS